MIKDLLRASDRLTDLLGLGGIFIICFLYAVFGPFFAEWNMKYSFLSFPIFVGEFLIAYSLLVFAFKWVRIKPKMTRWHDLFLLYFIWVVLKALAGNFVYGPLAFRNAALFYYPIFVLFGYTFFNRRFFKQETILFLIAVICCVLAIKEFYRYYWFISMNGFYSYFWFISLLIFITLSLKVKSKILRVFLFFSIPVIYRLSFLFSESRSHLLAIIIVSFFYIIYFAFFRYSVSSKRRIAISLGLILALCVGIGQFANKDALRSLLAPQGLLFLMNEGKEQIKSKEKDFRYVLVHPRLFSKNLSEADRNEIKRVKSARKMADLSWRMRMAQELARKYAENETKLTLEDEEMISTLGLNLSKIEKISKGEMAIPDYLYPIVSDEEEERVTSLEISYGNMAFRLFVWKDMIDELLEVKPLFGINFGKPQRSKSIEMLRWALFSWTRDGWVTPHNSFLHFVYRGGIVGIGVILFLASILFSLIRNFYIKKQTVGVLLSGALIYWIMLANFLVIFELPYHAIPFWTLVGTLYAYSKENTDE